MRRDSFPVLPPVFEAAPAFWCVEVLRPGARQIVLTEHNFFSVRRAFIFRRRVHRWVRCACVTLTSVRVLESYGGTA